MGYRYAVLGAGRQGTAAGYDLARMGDAEEVLFVDIDGGAAQRAAERVNSLLGRDVARSLAADVSDTDGLAPRLGRVQAIVGAVHFPLNPKLTDLAIRLRAHFCDMGGNTAVVQEQLRRNADAEKAGVSIIPDCGMGPGMNLSMATYAMSLMNRPREVSIWEGGLPQRPQPPWNYVSTFHIDGLTNEYSGHAHFLRGGQVVEVPCFDGHEEIVFPPPVGRLEAFVTSGGLSTAPWTFEGKLERLENRTVRYPGHWSQFRAYSQLGLFETEPVQVNGCAIVPREVFHTLLEPKIREADSRDVCVIRIRCRGESGGLPADAKVELIDRYDEKTGFSAMERVTGWHASILSNLAVKGQTVRGAVPVERAAPGALVVEEARRRGLAIEKTLHIDRPTKATK